MSGLESGICIECHEIKHGIMIYTKMIFQGILCEDCMAESKR